MNDLGGRLGDPRSPIPRSPRRRQARHPDGRLAHGFLAPSIVFLLVMTLPPFLYAIWVSFTRWQLTHPEIPQTFVGLGNYHSVLNDPDFFTALRHSIQYTLTSVALAFLFGLGLALLVNRMKRGKGAYLTLFLMPMVTTPVVVGLLFKYLLNFNYGILNWLLETVGLSRVAFLGNPDTALWSIIGVEVWQWTPFVTLVLVAGLESLPQRLFEAAEIDGASQLQIFRFVTLPQLKKVILIVLLIRTMDALRAFDLIFMMTKGGPGLATETLSIQAWREGFSFFNMGIGAALALLIFYLVITASWGLMQAAGITRAAPQPSASNVTTRSEG